MFLAQLLFVGNSSLATRFFIFIRAPSKKAVNQYHEIILEQNTKVLEVSVVYFSQRLGAALKDVKMQQFYEQIFKAMIFL